MRIKELHTEASAGRNIEDVAALKPGRSLMWRNSYLKIKWTSVKLSQSQQVQIGIIHLLIRFQAMKFMKNIHHSRLSRILFNIKDVRTEQRWNPNTTTSSGLLSPSTSSIMLFTAIIIPSSGVLPRLQIIPSGLSISYRQGKHCISAGIVMRFVSFANRTDSPAEIKSLRS